MYMSVQSHQPVSKQEQERKQGVVGGVQWWPGYTDDRCTGCGRPMLQAIPTTYTGHRFRSRLEARWAVFFDTLGVKWEYEREGYDLGEAGWYLPDFWLPKYHLFVEVKGGEISVRDSQCQAALHAASGSTTVIVGNIPAPDSPDTGQRFDYPLWDTYWAQVSGQDMYDLIVHAQAKHLSQQRTPYGFVTVLYRTVSRVAYHALVTCPWCRAGASLVDVTESPAADRRLELQWTCQSTDSAHGKHAWIDTFGITGKQVLPVQIAYGYQRTDIARALAGNRFDAACTAARSARFEHGETPRT